MQISARGPTVGRPSRAIVLVPGAASSLHCMLSLVSTVKQADGTTVVRMKNDIGDYHECSFPKDTPIEAIVGELVQGFNNLHSHQLAVQGDPHMPG